MAANNREDREKDEEKINMQKTPPAKVTDFAPLGIL